MFYLLIALIILACVLLVFIVLIQNPKGGGLASNFAGSNNLMGVKRTGDILEKGTWVLVVTIMVLSLMMNVIKHGPTSSGSGLQDQIVPTAMPAAPSLPTEAPAQEAPATTEDTADN